MNNFQLTHTKNTPANADFYAYLQALFNGKETDAAWTDSVQERVKRVLQNRRRRLAEEKEDESFLMSLFFATDMGGPGRFNSDSEIRVQGNALLPTKMKLQAILDLEEPIWRQELYDGLAKKLTYGRIRNAAAAICSQWAEDMKTPVKEFEDFKTGLRNVTRRITWFAQYRACCKCFRTERNISILEEYKIMEMPNDDENRVSFVELYLSRNMPNHNTRQAGNGWEQFPYRVDRVVETALHGTADPHNQDTWPIANDDLAFQEDTASFVISVCLKSLEILVSSTDLVRQMQASEPHLWLDILIESVRNLKDTLVEAKELANQIHDTFLLSTRENSDAYDNARRDLERRSKTAKKNDPE
jgi:hypothetical protein